MFTSAVRGDVARNAEAHSASQGQLLAALGVHVRYKSEYNLVRKRCGLPDRSFAARPLAPVMGCA